MEILSLYTKYLIVLRVPKASCLLRLCFSWGGGAFNPSTHEAETGRSL